MPVKPLRPCNKAGCRNLTRDRYCDEHKEILTQSKRERDKHYDKYKRDKEAAKFYSSKAWQVLREQALTRDLGLCQHCLANKELTSAEEVDHILPVKFFWEYRLDIDNLQALCHQCHSIKTKQDKKEYGF